MPQLIQLGKALFELRELCELTLEEVCDQIPGLVKVDLERIERGATENITPTQYRNFAKIYRVPPSFIAVLATIPDESPYPSLVIQMQQMIRESLQREDEL